MPSLGQRVQPADEVRPDRDGSLAAEDPIQRPAVPRQFFFGAVARPGAAQKERAQPAGRHRNAFNPVGGLGAMDHRLFPQCGQELGLLPHPQLLLAAGLHAGAEKPAGANRDCGGREPAGVRSQHVVRISSSLIIAHLIRSSQLPGAVRFRPGFGPLQCGFRVRRAGIHREKHGFYRVLTVKNAVFCHFA